MFSHDECSHLFLNQQVRGRTIVKHMHFEAPALVSPISPISPVFDMLFFLPVDLFSFFHFSFFHFSFFHFSFVHFLVLSFLVLSFLVLSFLVLPFLVLACLVFELVGRQPRLVRIMERCSLSSLHTLARETLLRRRGVTCESYVELERMGTRTQLPLQPLPTRKSNASTKVTDDIWLDARVESHV